jgi:hypothetical protein
MERLRSLLAAAALLMPLLFIGGSPSVISGGTWHKERILTSYGNPSMRGYELVNVGGHREFRATPGVYLYVGVLLLIVLTEFGVLDLSKSTRAPKDAPPADDKPKYGPSGEAL